MLRAFVYRPRLVSPLTNEIFRPRQIAQEVPLCHRCHALLSGPSAATLKDLLEDPPTSPPDGIPVLSFDPPDPPLQRSDDEAPKPPKKPSPKIVQKPEPIKPVKKRPRKSDKRKPKRQVNVNSFVDLGESVL